MKDILLHLAAAVVFAALFWLVGKYAGPSWSAALGAGLILTVRELSQIQSKHGHDFLKGWGEWSLTKIAEGPALLIPLFLLAWAVE